ncbi:hypothetical protein FH972_025079 [Carpinus fangiana]|uniref:Secreted protein n=1 Tax=Carpinus fangiana TaxID=176857 RepID=A0A5N6L050_9ROSI|nr:hypothetical protein FH972_025079 [Carpinus fangiana]
MALYAVLSLSASCCALELKVARLAACCRMVLAKVMSKTVVEQLRTKAMPPCVGVTISGKVVVLFLRTRSPPPSELEMAAMPKKKGLFTPRMVLLFMKVASVTYAVINWSASWVRSPWKASVHENGVDDPARAKRLHADEIGAHCVLRPIVVAEKSRFAFAGEGGTPMYE